MFNLSLRSLDKTTGLLLITLALAAFYLSLIWLNTYDLDRVYFNFLGIGTLFYLTWAKGASLPLNPSLPASWLGFLLVVWGTFSSLFLTGWTSHLSLYLKSLPLVFLVALILLLFGFKRLTQMGGLVLLAVYIMVVEGNLLKDLLMQISLPDQQLTAQLVRGVLTDLEFPATQQGISVSLSEVTVQIYPGCSSSLQIFYLVRLVVLFFAVFPPPWYRRLLLLGLAVGIGLVTNALRLALLVVVAEEDRLFDYWHIGDGAALFALGAMGLLGLACGYTALRDSTLETLTEEKQ